MEVITWIGFLFVAPEGFLIKLVVGTSIDSFFVKMNNGAFSGQSDNWGGMFDILRISLATSGCA